MAQPLSSLESAAGKLEQAFARLAAATQAVSGSHHSLKQDREKLNLLLAEAREKIATLKATTDLVVKRLDRTISDLEAEEDSEERQ